MKDIKEIKVNKLLKMQIIVIVGCIILGTLLHFTYKWSGENLFVASFSAVNESVWGHLKLVFDPMLIMAIIEYSFIKNIANNYIEAKTIGIFIAMSFMVVSFFTYTGIIGTNFATINILIFIISIILGEWGSYKLMRRKSESTILTKVLAGIITIFFMICFIFCTYYTPEVNLFRDFSNGEFGINNEK
jgi:hypothetical protein